jgi:flap endonuclease-1
MKNDPKGQKYTIPEDWPYKDARELFLHPDVRPADDPECAFEWKEPDLPGLVQYLVVEKGFSEDRVRSAAEKLKKNVKTAQQSRLEGFFKVVPKTEEQKKDLKRKADEKKEEQKKKAKLQAKAKKEMKSKPRGTA